MKSKELFFLVIIIIFAFVIRAYRVSSLSMYGDELTMVYDTYSLFKTGYDQVGDFLPLTFKMGAGRPAGYVYFSIPFVALFGPTVWGVRMLSILSGVFLSVLMYVLGKKLVNEKVGLLSAVFLTISPWDLSLSKGGFEAHFALFLFVLGFIFLLYAKKNSKFFLGWVFAWGLVIHTYPIYKLFLPLFLIVLLLFSDWFKSDFLKKNKKTVIVSLFVGTVFVLASVLQTLFFNSEERFLSINMFSQKDVLKSFVYEINRDKSLTDLPLKYSGIFHNKPTEYFKLFVGSYMDNFSTRFLFVKGDGNPRHNMGMSGQFYWVDLILIILGMFYIWEKNKRLLLVLVLWISLAPLPSSLLMETHALRSSPMLPPLIFLSAVGFYFLLINSKVFFQKVVIFFVVLVILFQLLHILNNLYFLSPNKFARFWSREAYLAVDLANKLKDKYGLIILSDKIDNIEYAYQVYSKVDPFEVIQQNKERKKFEGYDVKIFDNVVIIGIPNTRLEDFLSGIEQAYVFIGDFDEEGKYLSSYEKIETGDQTKYLLVKKSDRF